MSVNLAATHRRYGGTERRRYYTDEQLVALAKTGDDFAMGRIIDRYRTVVRRRARQYFVPGGDRQDLLQEGLLGLWKAVRDYRHERLTEFKSFAVLCITRQIISAIKAATRLKHRPLNGSVPLDNITPHEGAVFADFLPSACEKDDPAIALVAKERAEAIARVIRIGLSPYESDVIDGYLAGKTYEMMSLELEHDMKSIDNALQRAKLKISKNLKRAEDIER